MEGNFEAWDFGPVHPELYHEAKIFGARPVRNIFRGEEDLPDGHEKKIIEAAYDKLRDCTGAMLVGITHRSDGAWANNYRPGTKGIVIPNGEILEEYRKRSNRTNE